MLQVQQKLPSAAEKVIHMYNNVYITYLMCVVGFVLIFIYIVGLE